VGAMGLRNGARVYAATYVRACVYTRRNDWPVVIPSVVHPKVHAGTLPVPPPPPPRRGIHVCRVRYVVKRHNGGISENPDAESPTAGCRLETDFRPVRTRQSRLHATLQHLLNVSDGWIRIWMKRFKKDASQTGV